MRIPIKDISGQVFTRLTAISFVRTFKREPIWIFRCECGKEKQLPRRDVERGKIQSCGCLVKDTNHARKRYHNIPSFFTKYVRPYIDGEKTTPTLRSWLAMHSRCTDEAEPNYYGRGITVCEKWNSFDSFLADMGERPTGTTIDRFPNNSGNYEPGNYRWATPKQQANNRRGNRILALNGKTQTICQWADELGIRPITLRARLRYGWDEQRTLETPVQSHNLKNGFQT